MQISLLSRIQGALAGGAVADSLGACPPQAGEKRPHAFGIDGNAWRLRPLSADTSIPWSRQWMNAVVDWIRSGGGSWRHWGESCRAIQIQDASASAISLLPLIILTHTEPVRQRLALTTTITQAGWDFSSLLAAFMGASIINLALQNRLDPSGLIERLSLQIKELEPSVDHQQINGHLFNPAVMSEALTLLQTIRQLVQQSTGLAFAVEQLQETSTSLQTFGLALYCFLSTPEESGLTIMRALRCHYQPQLTATLAGILTGAYNGLGGIPIAWRSGMHYPQAERTAISSLWQIPSEQSLRQLSEVLFAAWSGVDIGLIQSMPYPRSADLLENGAFESGSL